MDGLAEDRAEGFVAILRTFPTRVHHQTECTLSRDTQRMSRIQLRVLKNIEGRENRIISNLLTGHETFPLGRVHIDGVSCKFKFLSCVARTIQ